jgi:hypothetical protein
MEEFCGECSVSDLTRQSSLDSTTRSSISDIRYHSEDLHDEFLAVAARHTKSNGHKCDCLNHLIVDDNLRKATALLHSAQLYLFRHTDRTVTNTKMDYIYKVLYGK